MCLYDVHKSTFLIVPLKEIVHMWVKLHFHFLLELEANTQMRVMVVF